MGDEGKRMDWSNVLLVYLMGDLEWNERRQILHRLTSNLTDLFFSPEL